MFDVKRLFHENIKKIILYGTNGVINTAITYGLFLVISQLIDYRITIGIVYSIGVLMSYFLNKRFVFKIRGRFGIFVVINITMFLTNLSITWSLVEGISVSKELSQLFAILVVFGLGYVLNKRYSFRSHNKASV